MMEGKAESLDESYVAIRLHPATAACSASDIIARTASDIITLDVGGTIFRTKVATLLGCSKEDPNNFFSSLLSTDARASSFFIDRNPEYFKVVLDYLRGSEVSSSGLDKNRLRVEFAYYGFVVPPCLVPSPSVTTFQRWLAIGAPRGQVGEFDGSFEGWMEGSPGEFRQLDVEYDAIRCCGIVICRQRGVEYPAILIHWAPPFAGTRLLTDARHLGIAPAILMSAMGKVGWKIRTLNIVKHQRSYVLQYPN